MGEPVDSEIATTVKPDGKPAPERERDEADDFGRAPATWVIGIAWVLVLVGMGLRQGKLPLHYNPIRVTIDQPTSDEFGALTGRALFGGQWWRTVTASFVHYNAWHLGINLLALLSLGWVVENWYGTGAFLLIYVMIAGLGNALAVCARLALRGQDVHSAGGSVVLFGLVTLVAVGGWRSRTRFGAYVKSRMVVVLVINAALGYLLRHSLDNYAHATGALVGAVLGLAHPWLRRLPGTVPGALLGLAGAAILAVCVADLVRDDRARWREEARLHHESDAWWSEVKALEEKARAQAALVERQKEAVRALNRLSVVLLAMDDTPALEPAAPPRDVRAAAAAALAPLAADPRGLDRGPTEVAFARLRALVGGLGPRGPSPPQALEFAALRDALARRLAGSIRAADAEIERLGAEHRRLLEHPPPGTQVIATRPAGR